MAALPQPPKPLAPNVQQYTPDGKPTPARVLYEKQLEAFLKAVAAAIGT